MMQLRIYLPTEILVDEPAGKVVAEAQNGSFCLLPRHANFVSLLTAGILTFTNAAGEEQYVGLTSGLLTKTADQVSVCVSHAVRGENIGELNRIIRSHFEIIDERERQAVSAVARLEAAFVRRILDLEGPARVTQ